MSGDRTAQRRAAPEVFVGSRDLIVPIFGRDDSKVVTPYGGRFGRFLTGPGPELFSESGEGVVGSGGGFPMHELPQANRKLLRGKGKNQLAGGCWRLVPGRWFFNDDPSLLPGNQWFPNDDPRRIPGSF